MRSSGLTLSLIKYTFLTRAWPTWARYFATFLIVLATLVMRVAIEQTPLGPALDLVQAASPLRRSE